MILVGGGLFHYFISTFIEIFIPFFGTSFFALTFNFLREDTYCLLGCKTLASLVSPSRDWILDFLLLLTFLSKVLQPF